jgi:hypothetical protein
VGLTVKQTRKRYAPAQPGELMIVHVCADCGALSINRAAADDFPDRLWEVFEASLAAPAEAADGIRVLGPAEHDLVWARVFGIG